MKKEVKTAKEKKEEKIRKDKIKQYESIALDAIKKNKLITVVEVASYLPISRGTFYNLELDKLNTIKQEINKNKINIKAALRAKWFKGKSAATDIALYKLCASEDELNILTQNRTQVTGEGGGAIKTETKIDWSKLSVEQLRAITKAVEPKKDAE